VVIAAEQYASRLVVPQSQQHSPMRWSSHKDQARKALAKLAGPNLPATLKQVEKAVAKAHSEHETAISRRTTIDRTAAVDEPVPDPADADEFDVAELQDEDLDDDVAYEETELVDVGGAVGSDGAVCSDADPGL
jgi:hypothetical protein